MPTFLVRGTVKYRYKTDPHQTLRGPTNWSCQLEAETTEEARETARALIPDHFNAAEEILVTCTDRVVMMADPVSRNTHRAVIPSGGNITPLTSLPGKRQWRFRWPWYRA